MHQVTVEFYSTRMAYISITCVCVCACVGKTAYLYNPSFEHPSLLADASGCPSYWPGGVNVVLILSVSDSQGEIIAADGNQLLGLQSNGAFIQQGVAFTAGLTYVLTFSAASRYDGIAALTVSIGVVNSMTVWQPLQSTSMATYSMRFVADASSNGITFTNTCGSYCYNMVFLDSVSLQLGKY